MTILLFVIQGHQPKIQYSDVIFIDTMSYTYIFKHVSRQRCIYISLINGTYIYKHVCFVNLNKNQWKKYIQCTK